MEGDDDSQSRAAPSSGSGEMTPPAHVQQAWRSWLSALASDAEAAMAAALTYESLPPEAREIWLDALGTDAAELEVPALALYAPLLAVELDPDRRRRIATAIANDRRPLPAVMPFEAKALRGVASDGTHACVIVAPLYLDFIQMLSCRYTPTGGFIAVSHRPLCHMLDWQTLLDAPEVSGVPVEPTPLGLVVEELAHAILADKREHRVTPAALASVAHLFGPDLEGDGEGENAIGGREPFWR